MFTCVRDDVYTDLATLIDLSRFFFPTTGFVIGKCGRTQFTPKTHFHFNTPLMILFYATEICQKIGGRSSRPEVLLRKGVLKICSKTTGEHPC